MAMQIPQNGGKMLFKLNAMKKIAQMCVYIYRADEMIAKKKDAPTVKWLKHRWVPSKSVMKAQPRKIIGISSKSS